MRPLPDVWIHRRAGGFTYGPLEGRASSRARRAPSGWAHVLWVLTRNEFRARYRAQALGVLWSLLHPLVMMAILSVIFTRVFKSQVAHFPVFMLVGLVLWPWLANGLQPATLVFVTHADVVKRTVFPRHLLPISTVLSYGINFAVESMLVVCMVFVWPDAFRLSPALLLIPVYIAVLATLLCGLSLATSVLNVVYRDVAYLVQTGLMLLYWLTPIVYPLDVVPEPYRTALCFNPMGSIVIAVRDSLMEGRFPSLLVWTGMLVPTAIIVAVGWAVFRHYERLVLDYV